MFRFTFEPHHEKDKQTNKYLRNSGSLSCFRSGKVIVKATSSGAFGDDIREKAAAKS